MNHPNIQLRVETLRQALLSSGEEVAAPGLPLGLRPKAAADFFISRTVRPALHDDSFVDEWIEARRAHSRLSTKAVPLATLQRWGVDSATGNIAHETGRFFTFTGIKVKHRHQGQELEWDQPIIDQPEVGILGILAQDIGGILHFCLQAKEEPGNIDNVQLSPTVQATYSNFSRAHGGTLPPFIELFLDPPKERLLFAKLQTEDGGRFLYKANRNMIVRLDDGAGNDIPETFIWLTLRQIALLLKRDNLINACTRSILANLLGGTRNRHAAAIVDDPRFSSLWDHTAVEELGLVGGLGAGGEEEDVAEAIQWLDDRKATHHILVKRVGMNTLVEWGPDGQGFVSHRDQRFFRIIGIDVTSEGREVPIWSQPIVDNLETGIIGLLLRERGGRRYFLMQAKAEAGNRTTVQLGPTVQFTPGNYFGNDKLGKPFLFDEFCGCGDFPVVRESWQAEEGARFYREEHLHRALLLPEGVELSLPSDYRWLAEDELQFFLNLGGHVNSCARSILSCLI